jgi:hypothetical protein
VARKAPLFLCFFSDFLWGIFASISKALRKSSGESKIAEFDLAKSVYQDVGRLKVSMDYVSGGKEVCGTQHIVEYGLNMLFAETQICSTFHELP